jgi:hypothetical protein
VTFEQWWNDVYCKGKQLGEHGSEAAAFMRETKRLAAEAAWVAGRMCLREEQSREIRAMDLEARNNAKKPG